MLQLSPTNHQWQFLFDDCAASSRPLRRKWLPPASSSGILDVKPIAIDFYPPQIRSPNDQITDAQIFILGNPGILEFYIPFLRHLSSLLPHTAILALSHIGHNPDLTAPTQPLHLNDQLKAKIELLLSLREALDELNGYVGYVKDEDLHLRDSEAGPTRRQGARISLIGHSVGAWMAVEAAKRLDWIDGVFMLFPTVGWIGQSANGRQLWPIFAQPLRTVLPLFAYLINPIIRLLLALPSLSTLLHIPRPTLLFLSSPRTIAHTLYLAKTEMETILAPDLDWFSAQSSTKPRPFPAKGGGKEAVKVDVEDEEQGPKGVYGIWSDEGVDKWVGREGRMVQEAMGGEEGGRVRIVGKIPHAFCLSQQHSEHIAEIIADWVGGRGKRSSEDDSIEQSTDAPVSSFPM